MRIEIAGIFEHVSGLLIRAHCATMHCMAQTEETFLQLHIIRTHCVRELEEMFA